MDVIVRAARGPGGAYRVGVTSGAACVLRIVGCACWPVPVERRAMPLSPRRIGHLRALEHRAFSFDSTIPLWYHNRRYYHP